MSGGSPTTPAPGTTSLGRFCLWLSSSAASSAGGPWQTLADLGRSELSPSKGGTQAWRVEGTWQEDRSDSGPQVVQEDGDIVVSITKEEVRADIESRIQGLKA